MSSKARGPAGLVSTTLNLCPQDGVSYSVRTHPPRGSARQPARAGPALPPQPPEAAHQLQHLLHHIANLCSPHPAMWLQGLTFWSPTFPPRPPSMALPARQARLHAALLTPVPHVWTVTDPSSGSPCPLSITFDLCMGQGRLFHFKGSEHPLQKPFFPAQQFEGSLCCCLTPTASCLSHMGVRFSSTGGLFRCPSFVSRAPNYSS